MKKISVIIPTYNEEGNIFKIAEELGQSLDDFYYELLFVDDGSTDSTLSNIVNLAEHDEKIKYISFSRNFGHQNALRAGIDHSDGHCVISIDADLQHPPRLIPKMIERWAEGFDIVFTKRIDDKKTSLIKLWTSLLFYRLINYLGDIKIETGSADFRLLDSKVCDIIRNSKENEIFFRGFVPWVGFRHTSIEYNVGERNWGKTSYSLHKMIQLALNGITGFSVKPLRLSTLTGFLISIVSFIYTLYVLYLALFTDKTVQGWASVLISVLFIGGIQLIFLGVLGEYVAKIFIQSKSRPSYIVSKTNVKPR